MENRTKQYVANFSAQLEAIQVLCRVHGTRKASDIKLLEQVLANVEFVKRMRTKVAEAKLKTMLQNLKYRYHRKEEFVFYQGDIEDNFYILIYGKVEVLLNRSEGALQSFKKLKELKSGNTFGEFTFTNIGEPRKYAIRCIEDCHLAYLERKEFFDLIQELRETISKQITSLKENPVFQYGWNQYDLMRFAISFTINHFTREMAIFKEGEKDRMIYFLNTGEVRSFKRIHNDKLDAGKGADKNAVKTYKNISLSLWKEGMIFGDEEFLKLRKGSNDPYGASNEDVNTCIREVTAVVNTANAEVWTMDAEIFFDLLQEKGEVYDDFVNVSNQKSKRRDHSIKKSKNLNELDIRKPRGRKKERDESPNSLNKSIAKLSDSSLIKESSLEKEIDQQALKAEVLEAHAKSPHRFEIVPAIPDFNTFDDRILPPIISKSVFRTHQSSRIENSPSPPPESKTARPIIHKKVVSSQEITLDPNKYNFIKHQNELIEKLKKIEKLRRPDVSSKMKVRPLFTKEDLKLSKENCLFACGPQRNVYAKGAIMSPIRTNKYTIRTLESDGQFSGRYESAGPLTRVSTLPEVHHKKNDSIKEKSAFMRHRDTSEDHYVNDSGESKAEVEDSVNVVDSRVMEEEQYRNTKFSALMSEIEEQTRGVKLPKIEKMIIIQPISPKRMGHFIPRKPLDRRGDEIIHHTKNANSMEKLRNKSKRKKPSLNFHLNGNF